MQEQRAFARISDSVRTRTIPKRMENMDFNLECEDVVTAKEAVASGVRNRLQKAKRVYEKGGNLVPTSNAKVIVMDCACIKVKCKIATAAHPMIDVQAKLEKIRLPGCLMSGMLEAARGQVAILQRRVANYKAAREKLAAKTA